MGMQEGTTVQQEILAKMMYFTLEYFRSFCFCVSSCSNWPCHYMSHLSALTKVDLHHNLNRKRQSPSPPFELRTYVRWVDCPSCSGASLTWSDFTFQNETTVGLEEDIDPLELCSTVLNNNSGPPSSSKIHVFKFQFLFSH